MKITSLFQLRSLIKPQEKPAPPPPAHVRGAHVELEGCWLRNVFEGARVRYDLLGFGPLLGGDDKER